MKEFWENNRILILSLAYIIMPLDIIPEAILGPMGLIDDIGLVITGLAIALIRHYIKVRNSSKQFSAQDSDQEEQLDSEEPLYLNKN